MIVFLGVTSVQQFTKNVLGGERGMILSYSHKIGIFGNTEVEGFYSYSLG